MSAVVVGASHPHQVLASAEAVELELDEERKIRSQGAVGTRLAR